METYKKGSYLAPKRILLLFQSEEPQFGIV